SMMRHSESCCSATTQSPTTGSSPSRPLTTAWPPGSITQRPLCTAVTRARKVVASDIRLRLSADGWHSATGFCRDADALTRWQMARLAGMSDLVGYELDDGIATVTLNNGKVNAISPDVIAE